MENILLPPFFAYKKKNKKIKSNNNNNKNQMIESTCFVYKNNFLGQRRRLWFYLFPHVHILLLERVFSVAGKPLVIPFMFVDTLFVLDMYIYTYMYITRDVYVIWVIWFFKMCVPKTYNITWITKHKDMMF